MRERSEVSILILFFFLILNINCLLSELRSGADLKKKKTWMDRLFFNEILVRVAFEYFP